MKPNLRSPYDQKPKGTTIKAKLMTVPGLALTNTEHIRKARLGISDQTVKLIFDPEDIFPDIRAMDLIDQRTMLKHAKGVVQEIMTKRKEHLEKLNAKQQAEAEQKAKELEKQMADLMEKQLSKQKQSL